MSDIIEILKRLEAMARANIETRARIDDAKRFVIENPSAFLPDEHFTLTVANAARLALRGAAGARI